MYTLYVWWHHSWRHSSHASQLHHTPTMKRYIVCTCMHIYTPWNLVTSLNHDPVTHPSSLRDTSIHVYTYTRTYVYTYTIYAYTYTIRVTGSCIHDHLRVRYAYTCLYVYAYICIYVYMSIRISVYMYIRIRDMRVYKYIRIRDIRVCMCEICVYMYMRIRNIRVYKYAWDMHIQVCVYVYTYLLHLI